MFGWAGNQLNEFFSDICRRKFARLKGSMIISNTAFLDTAFGNKSIEEV